MTEHEKNGHIIRDGLAYEDGRLTPTCDFDFDEIDRGNPLVAELCGASAAGRAEDFAGAMREILKWVWRIGNASRDTNSAFIRFAAMSAAIDPTLLDDQSYLEIGRRVGRTKANISAHALSFQRHFGVHFRRSRREASIAIFAKAQRGNSNRRKPKQEAPSE